MGAYGLDLPALPDQWTPLRAVVVIECLQDDGRVALATRCSEDLPLWSALGMLEAAAGTVRQDLVDCFEEEDADG